MRRSRDVGSETGTSVTETILLTWLMLVFFAAALQIFIMNESLFRSITATHAQMLKDGFSHNHWQYDGGTWESDCNPPEQASWNTYDTLLHAKEIWRYQDFPEIRVPVLGIFQYWAPSAGFQGLHGSNERIDIYSNQWPVEPEKGCDPPCKRITMGAGPAGPTDEGGPFWERPLNLPAIFRLYCKAGKSAIDSVSDAINQLENF